MIVDVPEKLLVIEEKWNWKSIPKLNYLTELRNEGFLSNEQIQTF